MKTSSLKALHNLTVKKSPREDVVMVNIEEEIMSTTYITVLDPKQLMEFADLDNLDAVHILIWMKYLNNQIAERKFPIHAYGFLSPKAFSVHIISYAKQFNSNARRLMSTKKLWLAPYNENMKHWVLMTIQVETKTVYWIDSCEGKPSDSIVKMITDVFEAKRGLCPLRKYESNTDPKFITLLSPKAPDDKQCAFYVFLSMWEVISGNYCNIPTQFQLTLNKGPDYSP